MQNEKCKMKIAKWAHFHTPLALSQAAKPGVRCARVDEEYRILLVSLRSTPCFFYNLHFAFSILHFAMLPIPNPPVPWDRLGPGFSGTTHTCITRAARRGEDALFRTALLDPARGQA
jgi:hypothetical protein